jgi:hypothetical protein
MQNRLIPPSSIVMPYHGCRLSNDMDALILSIRKHGLFCPVVVIPDGDSGYYKLMEGASRFYAWRVENERVPLPCLVIETVEHNVEAYIAQHRAIMSYDGQRMTFVETINWLTERAFL